MNKFLTKIVGAALGLTLAIGVGVAVGVNQGDSREVEAAASYNFVGNTVTFSEQGLTSGEAYNGKFTNGTFNVQFVSGGNNGKYYSTGAAVRAYAGGTFVVSTVDNTKKLASIVLTFGTGDNSNAITTNVTTYSDGTWEGSSQSVTFSVGGSSGHRRIATVTATLEAAADAKTITTTTEGLILTGDTSVSSGSSATVTLSTIQKKKIDSISVTGAGAQGENWTYTDKVLSITSVTADVVVTATLVNASINSITVSGYKTLFKIGDSFSFGGTVVGTYDDDAATHGTDTLTALQYEVDSSLFDSSVAGTYKITVSYGLVTANYDVTVKDISGALANGRYFIYNEDGALDPKEYTNSTSTKVSILASKAWDFELVDDDTYTISVLVDSTRYYIYSTNNNSGLRTQISPAEWYLEDLNDGTYALSTSDGTNTRWLCGYNDSKNDWRTYKETAVGEMYILNIAEEKDAFASNFLDSFTKGCKADGGYTEANMNWTSASTQFGTLSTANQAVFTNATYTRTGTGSSTIVTPGDGVATNVANVVARYEHIINAHGTGTFGDFMGRFTPAGVASMNSTNNNVSTSTIVIIVISSISLVAVSGYFVIRRRREN